MRQPRTGDRGVIELPEIPVPREWRRGFIVQMLIAGLTVTAIHATRPTVTYRALDLGATTVEIGLLQSAFSILPALLAVVIGRAVDRMGASRWMILAMLAVTIGGVIAAYASGLILLALAQMAMGLGQIIYLVAGQALVANHGPREDRDVRFGHYATVNSVGQLIGPAIAAAIIGGATFVVATSVAAGSGLSLVPDSPESVVFIVGAALTGLALALALLLPRLTRRPSRSAVASLAAGPGTFSVAGRVLRRPGMREAMFVSIVVISTMDVMIAYLPAYGEVTGLSVALVGGLLSMRAGASLVSRLFMAVLIARFGRGRLLAGGMAIAAVGMLGLPFATHPILLFAIMIAIGSGLGLVQPMTIAWVANRSPRNERGTALGIRITGNRVALLIVPTAMGAIAGVTGLAAIFIVMALALGVGAVVATLTEFDSPAERDVAVVEA